MATDDERRRAAERLRGIRRSASNVTQLNHGPMWSIAWAVLGDDLDLCGPGDWFESLCSRLADLIDPGDMSHGCRDTVACDREALLALADELEKCAWYFCLDFDADEPPRDRLKEASEDFAGFARRIREACGEVVG